MTPTPEQLERLRDGRRAALLRRWTEGQRLTDLEMSEICDLLPAETLSRPLPREMRYSRFYRDYAPIYGAAERTIKLWVRVGKENNDPPPLDQPVEMVAWWQRRMKHTVPDKLLEAAKGHPRPGAAPSLPPPSASAAGTFPAASGDAAAPTSLFSASAEGTPLGLADQVRSLERICGNNLRLLEEALNEKNEANVTIRQRNYERSLESLRKLKDTEQQIRIRDGDLVAIAGVASDLQTLSRSLAGMRRSMAVSVNAKLAHLTLEDRAAVSAAIEEVRAAEDRLIRDCRYWKEVPADALANRAAA